uniref:SPARC-like protein n=1 Tax=Dugesia japonica TaxID=6161 RepID=C0KQW5_DUGJA|nr:SPARC-like protein [Dugesia japonica]
MDRALIVALLCLFCSVEWQEERHKVDDEPEEEPSENWKCKLGEFNKEGKCNPMDQCPEEWNEYPRELCVDGKTYRHECDLWREKCYCAKSDSRCGGPEFGSHKPTDTIVIQYFDGCRDLAAQCDWPSEEASFHARLAMWFRDLYSQKWSVASGKSDDQSLLSPLSLKTRSSATTLFNATQFSPYGVHGGYLSFWFCEMDKNNNGNLDRSEIALLFQLLNPSTPCLNTFLSKCGSGTISFSAWNSCFKVPKAEEMPCTPFS